MSCGKGFETGNCVCDILMEIVAQQRDVLADCVTSCEQAIADLMGENGGTTNDTVPVLLYCKDGCTPFKGFGAKKGAINDIKASFYFRVKEVFDDCCATVELLRDPADNNDKPECPASQFTGNLETTGICMTVDLNCFCHVTCLPAIQAL